MALPFVVPALVGALVTAAGSIVGRVLISLGIGFVTYSGIDFLLNALKTQVVSGFGGLPATAVGILGLMKVDVAISIIFSALLARLVLNGLTSGKITKMILK